MFVQITTPNPKEIQTKNFEYISLIHNVEVVKSKYSSYLRVITTSHQIDEDHIKISVRVNLELTSEQLKIYKEWAGEIIENVFFEFITSNDYCKLSDLQERINYEIKENFTNSSSDSKSPIIFTNYRIKDA